MNYKPRVGDRIYNSGTWRRVRRAYYTGRHGLCERCGRPGDVVHHIIPIDEDNINDPNITFNHENLELLCHTCHNQEHKKTLHSFRKDISVTESGEIIFEKQF